MTENIRPHIDQTFGDLAAYLFDVPRGFVTIMMRESARALCGLYLDNDPKLHQDVYNAIRDWFNKP